MDHPTTSSSLYNSSGCEEEAKRSLLLKKNSLQNALLARKRQQAGAVNPSPTPSSTTNKSAVSNTGQSEDLSLRELAKERLLREAKRQSQRANQLGPQGWWVLELFHPACSANDLFVSGSRSQSHSTCASSHAHWSLSSSTTPNSAIVIGTGEGMGAVGRSERDGMETVIEFSNTAHL